MPDSGYLIHFAPAGCDKSHSTIRLGDVTRAVLMQTPRCSGSLSDQVAEVLDTMHTMLRRHEWPMLIPAQTVFLRDAKDQAACEKLFAASELHRFTVTHYVVEPPCSGAHLAVEAWAVGGPNVTVERLSPHSVAVAYDGIRWVHIGGVKPPLAGAGLHGEAQDVFQQTGVLLAAAGLDWGHVVRTWWQLGNITGAEGDTQRYMELNRARTEAFAGLNFGNGRLCAAGTPVGYPASTGIGMETGAGLTFAGLAMETERRDVILLPLENPLQTPAYGYAARYSPQSPKFSRAMALVMPDYLTAWISGTASIVNSEVLHPNCVISQTEQTLDNIAALVAPENFARHGQSEAGATLRDLAKVRVYVKRAADFAACQKVCQGRLGNIPAVYVVADICRPDLLVEIEGVAFARRMASSPKP